jgi:hypothetical protein
MEMKKKLNVLLKILILEMLHIILVYMMEILMGMISILNMKKIIFLALIIIMKIIK